MFDVSTAGISGLTTLYTGTGDSLVEFQGAIAGSFDVVGQAPLNVVGVTDSATTAQDWLIKPSETNRSGFAVSYSSITSLSLTTGTGADIVDLEDLSTNDMIVNGSTLSAVKTAIPARKDAAANPAKASLQAAAFSPGVFNGSTPITLSASSGQSVENLLLKKELLDGLLAAAASFSPG